MKTINIKGKEYVPVVERVKEFHNLFRGSIETDIKNFEGERISVKATVTIQGIVAKNETVMYENPLIFTGHSQAVYGTGMMGDVALEIAETSAVGRALGFANIGLVDGIASADEMRKVKKSDILDEEEPF